MSVNVFYTFLLLYPREEGLPLATIKETLNHSKFASGLEELCCFELLSFVCRLRQCWWMLDLGLGFALPHLAGRV